MPNKPLNELPKPTAEFDSYCETYTEQISQTLAFSGQSHDFFTRAKANHLAKIFAHKNFWGNSKGIHALDVGCGHGLIHPYLLEKTAQLKLSGVDVASSVIDVARKTNSAVSYQVYEGETLPYENNTFDIAFAICVMHHVAPPKWGMFLQEMKRVVKLNGLVVIFEHNPLNPLTLRVVKNCPLDKDAVLITSQSMKKLMQNAGLNVIRRKFILFTPFEKPIFQKMDQKLGWLPLGAQYYALSIKKSY
jgi:ubiquinone/menaquinone biosynthesis C-methylase UbiE